MSRSKSRAAAFTLVELLVVIGIIAVLISILLPVMGRARESANRAVCMSNLKQWYSVIMMYHDDYKTLPGPLVSITMAPDRVWNLSAAGGISTATSQWHLSNTGSGRKYKSVANPDILLNRYFKNPVTLDPSTGYLVSNAKFSPSVFMCPSNRDAYEEGRSTSSATYANVRMGYGYRFNNQVDTKESFFFGVVLDSGTSGSLTQITTYSSPPPAGVGDPSILANCQKPKKMTQVRQAGRSVSKGGAGRKTISDIWMMSDVDGFNNCDGGDDYDPTDDWFGLDVAITTPATRENMLKRRWKPPHRSGDYGRNYVFFDGSVRWYPMQWSDRVLESDSYPYNAYNWRSVK